MVLTEQVLYIAIAFVAIAFTSFYFFMKYRFTYWKKLGIPYIPPQFPLGNYAEAFSGKRTFAETMTAQYNEMKAKGQKYFGVYLSHNPAIVTVGPDFVKSIMLRDFGHFYDRGVFHDEENDPLSATLFSLEGQKWKTLRAKLTPTFTSGKLKKMFQTLVDCSLELKACLNEPICKNEPIDIKQISIQYTTDIIGSCAFGIECNSFKNSDTEFVNHGKKMFSPSGFDRAKLFFAILFPSLAKLLKLRITNRETDIFYRNLVKETVEYREKNNITRNDFMQLLIQLKNKGYVEYDEHDQKDDNKDNIKTDFKFTMNSLSAQAFMFFVAGFETSSTAMTWTLFELAQSQGIQDKLREEIVRILKKHDEKITYDGIMEMHYMERVIQESLRKYPPIPTLQRIVTSDYTIPGTAKVLKKGTTVLIPIIAIQRDPEYYPDPDKFDPERFTEENKGTRPDFTWFPFGDGPRVCIGLRFAMLQVKVGLCQLLLNYKFTLHSKTVNPPIFDPSSFVVTAKDTILMNAEKVTN